MDTSDSEYFESADEEFDDDYEKENIKIKQGQSHKIIEPELCKLKLEEENESATCVAGSFDDKSLKQKSNSVNNKDEYAVESAKVLVNILECDKDSSENQSVKKIKTELAQNSDFSADVLELSHENTQNSSTIKIGCSNTKLESVADLEKKCTTEYKVLDKRNESEENNLWDDDELDWGSEELEKVVDTRQSNNEDSGWDDFDVDWETSVQSANLDAVTDKKVHNLKKSLTDEYEDWETLEKPEEKQKLCEESESSWGGWGSWGVSSILNTATQSVSTLTNHVSQGLSAVLEGGMGIPDPEELAKFNISNQEKIELNDKSEISNIPVAFGLGNLVTGVSHLTKFVESTGTKVIAGSLDTLEAIGKKTVEVLQEGDPGFKKKRAFLKLEAGKPNLSQILREAKEKAEEVNHEPNVNTKKFKNYETLFDDHQGLVHLEALEMLSRVCSIKLDNLNNTLTGDALKEMQETLEQVKELCELPEDEDEDYAISSTDAKTTIENAVKEINIPVSYNKLFLTCEDSDNWLNNINKSFIDDFDLYQQAIETLAQLTAVAVEQFHKTGELLMVKEHRSTADEADSLVQITTTLKVVILNQASKFTEKINMLLGIDKQTINEEITNIFYEAANSGTYIQTAFQLLIPVLQVGAI